MAKPYPQALGDRVFAAYGRGVKTKAIATLFQVSPPWARRLKQRRRETGQTARRPMGGITVTKIDMDRLRQLLQQQPAATAVELHDAQLNVDCSVSAVDMALRRLGWSYRKRRFTRLSRIGRMSRNNVSNGKTISLGMTATGCFSSMRRGPRRT